MASLHEKSRQFRIADEARGTAGVGDDEAAALAAAAALRQVEVEAADPELTEVADAPADFSAADLENMSIDEVRALANKLNIPARSQIIDKSELIAEIRRRM